MKQYLNLLAHVLNTGNHKKDRTGTGTISVFGHQMRFNLQEAFPLVTTKKIHMKSVIHELLWMLSGDTNVEYLQENGVRIWDEWADPETGDLGPVYGKQWRRWEGQILNAYLSPVMNLAGERDIQVARYTIDQIAQALDKIKNDPDSRRILVVAWNPADAKDVKLHWCHCLFQFYVNDGELSCQVYIRSSDIFLGLPFNIASYALLTHMFAQQADLGVGELIITTGDTHLYLNHLDQAEEQLKREPKSRPQLIIKRKPETINDYKFEDFEIAGYDPHPAIKAEVSV